MVGVRHEESKADVGDKDNAGKKVFFFFIKSQREKKRAFVKKGYMTVRATTVLWNMT